MRSRFAAVPATDAVGISPLVKAVEVGALAT